MSGCLYTESNTCKCLGQCTGLHRCVVQASGSRAGMLQGAVREGKAPPSRGKESRGGVTLGKILPSVNCFFERKKEKRKEEREKESNIERGERKKESPRKERKTERKK